MVDYSPLDDCIFTKSSSSISAMVPPRLGLPPLFATFNTNSFVSRKRLTHNRATWWAKSCATRSDSRTRESNVFEITRKYRHINRVMHDRERSREIQWKLFAVRSRVRQHPRRAMGHAAGSRVPSHARLISVFTRTTHNEPGYMQAAPTSARARARNRRLTIKERWSMKRVGREGFEDNQ